MVARKCRVRELAFGDGEGRASLPDSVRSYFEARSTYEILGKFLITFCRIIFAQALNEENLKGILREDGLDVAWATLLHDKRILFFHQTAPWLALMFDDTKALRLSF